MYIRWLIIIIIIFFFFFTRWDLFVSVLVDGFSVEFAWQQISSSLKDSYQYSDRSQ